MRDLSIAVLIPCLNEAQSIANVITDIQTHVPSAQIVVIDNGSTDATIDIATAHQALVIQESQQGKGAAMRRAFAMIDADVFAVVDGDATYQISKLPEMIGLLQSQLVDMVIGVRIETSNAAYPAGHKFGNKFFNTLLRTFFQGEFSDIFTGYRVMTRRFVKSFPAMSNGFQIETELSIHALMQKIPCLEIATEYSQREIGSESKLHTYRDGLRIFFTLVELIRSNKPLIFYGALAAAFAVASLLLGTELLLHFLQTGLVPRLPTAVLAAGLGIVAATIGFAGVILHSTVKYQTETKRLLYLALSRFRQE